MAMTRSTIFTLAAAALLLLPLAAAAQGTVRIVQTNSAGDNVHIIDPVTNTVSARSRVSSGRTAPRRRRTGAGCTSPTKRTIPSTSSTSRQ